MSRLLYKNSKKIDQTFHVKCTQYDESYRHFIPYNETQKNSVEQLKKAWVNQYFRFWKNIIIGCYNALKGIT